MADSKFTTGRNGYMRWESKNIPGERGVVVHRDEDDSVSVEIHFRHTYMGNSLGVGEIHSLVAALNAMVYEIEHPIDKPSTDGLGS